MPNHVSQKLIVTADPEMLSRIKEASRHSHIVDGETKEFAFSESAFFPMPEDLQGTISGPNAIVTQEEYDAFMADTESVERNKRLGIGTPMTVDVAAQLQLKYGCSNWYDWAIANWGTKWGVYAVAQGWDDVEGGMSITFESAWSPASKIVARLSHLFPKATFRLEYIDEGWGFAGFDLIQDGGITSEYVVCDRDNLAFVSLADSIGYTIYDDEEDED